MLYEMCKYTCVALYFQMALGEVMQYYNIHRMHVLYQLAIFILTANQLFLTLYIIATGRV